MKKLLKSINDSLSAQALWIGMLTWLGFFWAKVFGISDMHWILVLTGAAWVPLLAYLLLFIIYTLGISIISIVERRIDNDKCR